MFEFEDKETMSIESWSHVRRVSDDRDGNTKFAVQHSPTSPLCGVSGRSGGLSGQQTNLLNCRKGFATLHTTKALSPLSFLNKLRLVRAMGRKDEVTGKRCSDISRLWAKMINFSSSRFLGFPSCQRVSLFAPRFSVQDQALLTSGSINDPLALRQVNVRLCVLL